MAKRGEVRPFRMEYRWTNAAGRTTVTGSETFTTRERADDAAVAQRRRIGPNGETCAAVVKSRPT